MGVRGGNKMIKVIFFTSLLSVDFRRTSVKLPSLLAKISLLRNSSNANL
jgi:hypothetical protein